LELAFEGYNLHEEMRLQTNVGLLAWNSPKLFVKINSALLYSLERKLDIFYLIPSFIDDG
jgi:hypothetical protein